MTAEPVVTAEPDVRYPLAGKKMVVTGGSRGIGAAIVRLAAAQGADVVFGYSRNDGKARALVDEMRSSFPERQCLALRAQVADLTGAEEFTESALECLGSLDILVNNAGVARDTAFARMRPGDWEEVVHTNLGSMFNVTRPLITPLVKRRRGAIVNISSIAGVYGSPGQVNYSASKAGIIGFTKALAKEVAGSGITVNAVAPGLIETDMMSDIPAQRLEFMKSLIPARRLGAAEDVAHMVCFLASDRARYVTGQVIEVAGGLAF